ncbi:Vesicle transport v-SNARE protein N-terminus [Musa troglodytarum]|uniref:Vesicle transport v-SNARE protein N-terminus n=1 Tax=Musa troglodytarum TaxID=320322 RepID=A0A9E7EGN2_9LILI|nr:Vesicle transport v-SNARE protein N-terminus [Musa troglodytarum]
MSRPRAPPSQSQDLRLESNAITMSEVFYGYGRQCCEISASLSRKCTSAALLDGVKKKQKIRKMNLEARSLQPSIKVRLLAKLREYKSDIHILKSEFKRITIPNPSQAAREEPLESGMADKLTISVGNSLCWVDHESALTDLARHYAFVISCIGAGDYSGGDGFEFDQVSADQRARFLMSTERLNKSSGRIKQSIRTTLESEEVGVSVLQDLHQHGRPLLHAHLHGGDGNFSKSKRMLTAMSRRMDRNKWIIGGIIVALVLAIILILYFKLAH